MNKEPIQYPSGVIKKTMAKSTLKRPNQKKSRLGTDFEEMINHSNDFYLQKSIAAIYKKPTPVQIVKVDYPARNKARIIEAYYKTPSTTDYNGIYHGKYIDFEAKSCHSNRFSFGHIYDHQVEHLERVAKMGGIAFLLIEFALKQEVYLLPIEKLLPLYQFSLTSGPKSIPYSYFKEEGVLIPKGFGPQLDYLKMIETYYFNKLD